MKRVILLLLICSVASFGVKTQAGAFGLPALNYGSVVQISGDNYHVINGVPVGKEYGDFWSYSSWLLEGLRVNGHLDSSLDQPYIFATGSGGLDIILYTGAGGIDNQSVGPGGAFSFEDPVYNSGGNITTFSGWWGQNDQNNDGTITNVNGPVTVGQLSEYLMALSGLEASDPIIPVFYMDLNQTGVNPDLDIWGRVSIIDPDNSTTFDEWIFSSDGEAGNHITAQGNLQFQGEDGETYEASASKGSGKPDFIAYAPTMNLIGLPANFWFVTEFHFGQDEGNPLTNGYEELFLTSFGDIARPIPEPTTMILLGAGLLGLSAGFRRKLFKR